MQLSLLRRFSLKIIRPLRLYPEPRTPSFLHSPQEPVLAGYKLARCWAVIENASEEGGSAAWPRHRRATHFNEEGRSRVVGSGSGTFRAFIFGVVLLPFSRFHCFNTIDPDMIYMAVGICHYL